NFYYDGLKMGISRILKRDKGQGVISVIIAAGLVVLVGLAVNTLISNYNTNSIHLENSEECQMVAKQVHDYILKDDNGIMVSSYGSAPGTTNFGAGLDFTDDNIDRFFWGAPVSTWTVGPNPLSLGPNTAPNPVNPPFPTMVGNAGWSS